MARRLPHLLVTLWWLTWVFIIIPCHTRGAISVGGCPECDSHDNTPLFFGSVDTSCPFCAKAHTNNQTPSNKSSRNCAICQLVATTPNPAPPPPLLLNLRLVEILPPVTPSGTIHFFPFRPYHSRAPPIA